MLKTLPVLLFTIYFSASYGQNKKGIEGTIRNLEQQVVKAILDADSNSLKKLWDPKFIVNTPRNDIAKDRAAVLENQKIGLINYSSFERNIEGILIEDDVVITLGYEVFVSRTTIPGAKAGEPVKRRFTNVWKKKKGKWMQIGRHASIICS